MSSVRQDSRRSSGSEEGGTRSRILRAGTQLFAQQGYAAASMRELAERAGVALSASYYHFPAKHDVLVAIMDEAMEDLEQGALGVLEKNLPPVPRLSELVRAHVRSHLHEPERARVGDAELRALDPEERARTVAIRDRYEGYFRDALQEGIEEGSFDKALDVPVVAMAIITTGTSTIEWWKPAGRLSIEDTALIYSRLGVAMAMHGATPAPGAD